MKWGVHEGGAVKVGGGGCHEGTDGSFWSTSGLYTSYWNVFLFTCAMVNRSVTV